MIQHETVQLWPRLPFKFYEHDPLTSIGVSPHWHQGIELNYLVAGPTLKFETDGTTRHHQPGAIWAVDRRVVHSASGAPSHQWDEFGLIIDDQFLLTQLPESADWSLRLFGAPSQAVHPEAYAQLALHLNQIRDLLHQEFTDVARLLILSHFYQVLALLADNFTELAPSSPPIQPNAPLVDQVINYLDRNYGETISSAEVAHRFHVSQTTLNQQFNANVQMSLNRYLRLVRLLNARKLLLETDDKIDYIAQRCGFGNRKNLNRNFQTWKGTTPSAYRQAYARYHR
ncbi:helix-turn-helix domain-containing protein [Lapidilactobacillus achengensis]|uniref:Helix-turn-helix domain-containing protein n=1 Tax=Lapidilactobacillus achengensis TaxID=2486000 RepID=A0ABW1UMR1_9LACO|nr:AraC family transcriptional regulator [Lapidilactobacillus achengensis]